MNDDTHLLARLREHWERTDPAPPGLVDHMLAAVAAEDLDVEYELLTLLESAQETTGARHSADPVVLAASRLHFGSEHASVVLRIAGADGRGGDRRIDGYVAMVSVSQARVEWVAGDGPERPDQTVDIVDGRFSVPSAPSGLVRVWLTGPDPDTTFATPAFEI